MPFSADPLSLTTRIGKIIVISSPEDQALSRLDWGKWVSNTALRYIKFSSPAPRRIFLLDNNFLKSDQSGSMSLEYARQDIQSADILNLLGGWTENTLLLAIGAWKFSMSSWIESLRSIAHAKYSERLIKFFEEQTRNWREMESKFSDDSLFVVSDSGSRFFNAGEICRSWVQRIFRSKITQEPKNKGWAACLVSVNPEGASQEGKIRLHRISTLEPFSWCGDPNWQANLPTFVLSILSKCNEFWISLPYNVLVQDVFEKVSQGMETNKIKVYAPSVCLGWHPVRDFSLFLGSSQNSRVFIFMDSQERLQIIFAESVGET